MMEMNENMSCKKFGYRNSERNIPIQIIPSSVKLVAVDTPVDELAFRDVPITIPTDLKQAQLEKVETHELLCEFIRTFLSRTGLPVSKSGIYPPPQGLGGGGAAAGFGAISIAEKIFTWTIKVINVVTSLRAWSQKQKERSIHCSRPTLTVDVQVMEGTELPGTRSILASLPSLLEETEAKFPGSRITIRIFPRPAETVSDNWFAIYAMGLRPDVNVIELEHESVNPSEIKKIFKFLKSENLCDSWQYRARKSPNRILFRTRRFKPSGNILDPNEYEQYKRRERDYLLE